MAFSVFVEMLNVRMKTKAQKKRLESEIEQIGG
jgi:hypothetical protein